MGQRSAAVHGDKYEEPAVASGLGGTKEKPARPAENLERLQFADL